MNIFDIAVIGGGAAGLCAAVTAKECNGNLNVAVLEKLDRVGKKLITTGNGRCNITNKRIDISNYHGNNVRFCRCALERFGTDETEKFFQRIGVVICYEPSGKAYPLSFQAGSVVDCLRFAAQEHGVDLLCGMTVTDIIKKDNMFKISTSDGDIAAKTVIVAAGLLSGGERLGCDGSVLKIMKRTGYKTVKATPSIVQIKTENTLTKKLKGIKVDAAVALKNGKKVIASDSGEVLFTDYGLSGPPVMQISRQVERSAERMTVSLDLLPQYTEPQLEALLMRRVNALSARSSGEFLTGILNKRVGQIVLGECGAEYNLPARSLAAYIPAITGKIKAFDFKVTGTTGFLNSQVTAGGVDTVMFDERSLQSKLHSGLFAAGEILDIDGDCGGFNLQWAWSSGMLAAHSAAALLQEGKI